MQFSSIADDVCFRHRLYFLGYTCAAMLCLGTVQAASWTLTPASKVGFKIDAFGMTFLEGQFTQVQSVLTYDGHQLEHASVWVEMDINSVRLNKPKYRDSVLGPDLFYGEKYKTAIFKSAQFKALGNNQYQIYGYLTLRGVTRPISFEAKLAPHFNNPQLLDVEAYTIIHRRDFGMKKAFGGIGEKVNIQIMGQWKNVE